MGHMVLKANKQGHIMDEIVLAANKQADIYPPQRENTLFLADTRNCVNNALVVPPLFWG